MNWSAEKSGATSQLTEFFDASGASAMARAYGVKQEIAVRTTAMDAEIAAGTPVPDLITIDIESAEVLALKGAQHLLDLGRTIIAFESCTREASAFSEHRAGRFSSLINWTTIWQSPATDRTSHSHHKESDQGRMNQRRNRHLLPLFQANVSDMVLNRQGRRLAPAA